MLAELEEEKEKSGSATRGAQSMYLHQRKGIEGKESERKEKKRNVANCCELSVLMVVPSCRGG